MENFDIIAAKMLQSETVSEVENHRARLIERDSAREPEKAGEWARERESSDFLALWVQVVYK